MLVYLQKKPNFKEKLTKMIKTIKTLVFLILLSNQVFSQSSSLISSGNEKLQKKNYTDALTDFSQALKESPDNVQALCGSALAQNGMGKTKEALTTAESTLQKNPKSDIANYTKGEVLLSTKDFEGAIASYNKALEINNSHFPSYVSKSKAYNLMGNIKEAYKVLDNAIDAFPSSAELFFARGLLNNSKEKYSKALSDFDKAITLNSNNKVLGIYYNRGVAYSFLEEYESALADFNKAAELDPSNPNVYYSRGLANYQLANFEASVKDFLKSDELYPNNPVNLYNLGMAYYKSENIENACMYFHKSCSLNNTNACKMIIMVCSNKQQIK